MTSQGRLIVPRLVAGAKWVGLAYGLYVLVSLAFVALLLGVLLFASWGLPVWLFFAGLFVVVTAIHWRVARTAGLIRVAVVLPFATLAGIGMAAASDSPAAMYAIGATSVLALTFLPNLAVKRYERHRSRPSPSH
jgi:hypothetical protein